MKEIDLKSIAEDISILLPAIQRKLMRPIEQQARQAISPLTLHAMGLLSEKSTFTMTELAKEIHVSKQQLTPIIDKLINSQLVCREHDETDRRMINIKLTPAGINFLEDFHKEVQNNIKLTIEHLDDEDLSSLQNALTELSRILNKL